VTLGNGERFKVTVWNGVETIKPQGSELYSDGKYYILFDAVDQLDRQNRGS
jgi:biotin operon repressor